MIGAIAKAAKKIRKKAKKQAKAKAKARVAKPKKSSSMSPGAAQPRSSKTGTVSNRLTARSPGKSYSRPAKSTMTRATKPTKRRPSIAESRPTAERKVYEKKLSKIKRVRRSTAR